MLLGEVREIWGGKVVRGVIRKGGTRDMGW